MLSLNRFGVEGTARVTVIFTEDVMANELPETVAASFKSATSTDDSALLMTYPLDNVIIPRNLEDLDSLGMTALLRRVQYIDCTFSQRSPISPCIRIRLVG